MSTTRRRLRSLNACRNEQLNENYAVFASGVKSLTRFSNLEALDISAAPLEDKDLAAFTEMQKLKSLVLNNTKISNAGLATLMTLSSLEELYVIGTKVTEDGAGWFKRERPQVRINAGFNASR